MADNENKLTLETTQGPVVIELRPDLAPNTSSASRQLVGEGFYDGSCSTASSTAFMAQTGCPHRHRHRRLRLPEFAAEFTPSRTCAATLSMAARAEPEQPPTSQFFNLLRRRRFLDKQYTVWGKVVEGMENVDKIKPREPGREPRQDRESDRSGNFAPVAAPFFPSPAEAGEVKKGATPSPHPDTARSAAITAAGLMRVMPLGDRPTPSSGRSRG